MICESQLCVDRPQPTSALFVALFSLLSLGALSFPLLPEHQKELHVSNPLHHSVALSKASLARLPLPPRKTRACAPVHVQHAWTDAEENEVVETMHKHHSHIMGINLLQEDEAKQTAIKLKVRRRASDLPAPSAALVHVRALPFGLMVHGNSHRTT